MLERRWRMMGALEAANGMLLFGISTAYIFAVMQVYWPMLAKLGMTPFGKAAHGVGNPYGRLSTTLKSLT